MQVHQWYCWLETSAYHRGAQVLRNEDLFSWSETWRGPRRQSLWLHHPRLHICPKVWCCPSLPFHRPTDFQCSIKHIPQHVCILTVASTDCWRFVVTTSAAAVQQGHFSQPLAKQASRHTMSAIQLILQSASSITERRRDRKFGSRAEEQSKDGIQHPQNELNWVPSRKQIVPRSWEVHNGF